MSEKDFKSKITKIVIKYIKEQYGDNLEFLWEKYPSTAVFRRKDTKKWYCIFMPVSKDKFGFKSKEIAEVINLKAPSEEIIMIVDNKTIFPAYHMNKKHWISIILDGSLDIEEIYSRIDISYNLVGKNKAPN